MSHSEYRSLGELDSSSRSCSKRGNVITQIKAHFQVFYFVSEIKK